MTQPPATDVTPGDIASLIMNDHEWFRRAFAALDDLRADGADVSQLTAAWQPLATRLDLHALAEEEIFYPALLRVGEDSEEETIDAIGDHNDIRDGVHAAERHEVGSDGWWDAVHEARVANDEHMAEEERDGIPDFKAHASAELQDSLGHLFGTYLRTHRTTEGVDTSDKDPEEYVREETS